MNDPNDAVYLETFLQSNWTHHAWGSIAFDFDGIFCHDYDWTTNDDHLTAVERFEKAIPLFRPWAPVSLVITGRGKRFRKTTERWMHEHGMEAKNLIMRDWEWGQDPYCVDRVAEWKAGQYLASPHRLYVESDPHQAELIAIVSGKAVLCPQVRRLIPGRETTRAVHGIFSGGRGGASPEVQKLVDDCREWKESSCGCHWRRKCLRGPVPEDVHRLQCIRCKAAEVEIVSSRG